MGFRYFDGKNWSDITREERFFTQRLYQRILDGDALKFVAHVNHVCGTRLATDCEWEAAFEAAFYRDLWSARGRTGRLFSPKRTFDLCLFSDDAIVVIEAKAFQAFDMNQTASFVSDRNQIREETGVPAVHLIGLASSRYVAPTNIRAVFDGPMLTWKGLAQLYGDAVLLRADTLHNPEANGSWGKRNVSGYMTGAELLAAHKNGERFLVGRGGGLDGAALRKDVLSGNWRSQRYETDRSSSVPPNRNWFWLREFARLLKE